MKREELEQLIALLDSQSGELAARTSSALLAAGDQVEPLLQTRLGQTDKCRGLALVAGILASRNAAAADVEAAFTRVLEGKCDGREPFDLQLAQGVAAAFVTRPDGIAKVARLLVHRDVSVRRRAAEAFSTLFERLGSGEHAQAAASIPRCCRRPARRSRRSWRSPPPSAISRRAVLACGRSCTRSRRWTMRCAPTPRRRPPAARSAAWRPRIPDRGGPDILAR